MHKTKDLSVWNAVDAQVFISRQTHFPSPLRPTNAITIATTAVDYSTFSGTLADPVATKLYSRKSVRKETSSLSIQYKVRLVRSFGTITLYIMPLYRGVFITFSDQLSTHCDGFALKLVMFQVLQSSVGVLSSVHADESTPSGRDQVDGHDVAKLSKRVGQLFLLHQLGQMTYPQRSTADCNKYV